MDESLTATIRESMPLAELLGFEAVEGGPEGVTLRGTWSQERCTAAGVLHGGYLTALADSAAATLAFLNLPPGATTSTIEAKTPRLRRRLVSLAKKPSTALSQDEEVGVKWNVQRSCLASQAVTLGCLWVA